VPGSSLKGRARYLLEWAFGLIRHDGHPWGFNENDSQQTFDSDDPVQRIFGTPAKRERWQGGPTRLICRDALLNPSWREDVLNRSLNYTEDKTEVVIDRSYFGSTTSTTAVRGTVNAWPGLSRDWNFLSWTPLAVRDPAVMDALNSRTSVSLGSIGSLKSSTTYFGDTRLTVRTRQHRCWR
jgi:hypothetical protein